MSQADLVADLERVTGWRLPRENYSKYETGALNPEPETLARFTAYWRARGGPELDLTPAPEAEPEPTLASALMALARSGESMARELAELRVEREAQARAILALAERVAALEARGPAARPAPRVTAR